MRQYYSVCPLFRGVWSGKFHFILKFTNSQTVTLCKKEFEKYKNLKIILYSSWLLDLHSHSHYNQYESTLTFTKCNYNDMCNTQLVVIEQL